jgi:hypothetical protein
MTDFSNVSKLTVRGDQTATYEFEAVGGRPELTVRPATEANRAYLNGVLQKGRRMLKQARGKRLSPELLVEAREQDFALYARCVVTGWKRVRDASGAEVLFSVEACEEFLRALPPEMFDELRSFCSTAETFRPASDDQPDLEDAAGN